MSNSITYEDVNHIVEKLLHNSNKVIAEAKNDRSNLFNAGRKVAYYETLDTIKNWLTIYGKNFSKNISDNDFEKKFMS
ncbi:MAG: hypothetical protein IJS29_08440 [Selenomonadaceae bacterium]|nr:hypothetical protein [Selenomonadaceae bacterium]